MRSLLRSVVTIVVLGIASYGLADYSSILGATLLGFDEISSFDDRDLHSSAASIIRGYARDVGMTCGRIEVFYRDGGVTSYAMSRIESAVGFGNNLRELHSSFNETIFVVFKQFGSDVIGTLIRLDDGGFILIVC